MSFVYCGLFDSVYNWVLNKIISPVFELVKSVLSTVFTFIYKNVVGPILDATIGQLARTLLDWIIDMIFRALFNASKYVLQILDCLADLFDTMLGVQNVKFKGQEMTLLRAFLNMEAVRKAFWYINFFALGLAVIFAVYGVARSMMDLDFENKRPISRVMSSLLNSVLNLFTIQLVVFGIIYLAEAILTGLSSAMALANGSTENTTLGRMIFIMGSLNAALNGDYNITSDAAVSGRIVVGPADDIRKRFYGLKDLSAYNVKDVEQYFNLRKLDYFVLIAVGAVFALLLLVSLLVAVRRIFNMLLLYVVSPLFAATIPLDDGEVFGKWRNLFIGTCFTGYGMLVSMKLYILICPMIMGSELQLTDSIELDFVCRVVFLLGGLWAVYNSSSMITGLISGEAAGAENEARSTGESLAQWGYKTVSDHLKKNADKEKQRQAQQREMEKNGALGQDGSQRFNGKNSGPAGGEGGHGADNAFQGNNRNKNDKLEGALKNKDKNRFGGAAKTDDALKNSAAKRSLDKLRAEKGLTPLEGLEQQADGKNANAFQDRKGVKTMESMKGGPGKKRLDAMRAKAGLIDTEEAASAEPMDKAAEGKKAGNKADLNKDSKRRDDTNLNVGKRPNLDSLDDAADASGSKSQDDTNLNLGKRPKLDLDAQGNAKAGGKATNVADVLESKNDDSAMDANKQNFSPDQTGQKGSVGVGNSNTNTNNGPTGNVNNKTTGNADSNVVNNTGLDDGNKFATENQKFGAETTPTGKQGGTAASSTNRMDDTGINGQRPNLESLGDAANAFNGMDHDDTKLMPNQRPNLGAEGGIKTATGQRDFGDVNASDGQKGSVGVGNSNINTNNGPTGNVNNKPTGNADSNVVSNTDLNNDSKIETQNQKFGASNVPGEQKNINAGGSDTMERKVSGSQGMESGVDVNPTQGASPIPGMSSTSKASSMAGEGLNPNPGTSNEPLETGNKFGESKAAKAPNNGPATTGLSGNETSQGGSAGSGAKFGDATNYAKDDIDHSYVNQKQTDAYRAKFGMGGQAVQDTVSDTKAGGVGTGNVGINDVIGSTSDTQSNGYMGQPNMQTSNKSASSVGGKPQGGVNVGGASHAIDDSGYDYNGQQMETFRTSYDIDNKAGQATDSSNTKFGSNASKVVNGAVSAGNAGGVNIETNDVIGGASDNNAGVAYNNAPSSNKTTNDSKVDFNVGGINANASNNETNKNIDLNQGSAGSQSFQSDNLGQPGGSSFQSNGQKVSQSIGGGDVNTTTSETTGGTYASNVINNKSEGINNSPKESSNNVGGMDLNNVSNAYAAGGVSGQPSSQGYQSGNLGQPSNRSNIGGGVDINVGNSQGQPSFQSTTTSNNAYESVDGQQTTRTSTSSSKIHNQVDDVRLENTNTVETTLNSGSTTTTQKQTFGSKQGSNTAQQYRSGSVDQGSQTYANDFQADAGEFGRSYARDYSGSATQAARYSKNVGFDSIGNGGVDVNATTFANNDNISYNNMNIDTTSNVHAHQKTVHQTNNTVENEVKTERNETEKIHKEVKDELKKKKDDKK